MFCVNCLADYTAFWLWYNNAVRSQKVVTGYFESQQLLNFSYAR